MAAAVTCREVSFAYRTPNGSGEVLHGVDLQVSEGCIFGLLGPNGAGKTTLLRCIIGLLAPHRGKVEVFGQGPDRSSLRNIGVIVENPGVYRKLNALEYLRFFGTLYQVENTDERIGELADSLSIDTGPKPLGKRSLGQRQKIHIARSLLHAPRLILWDEPFGSLDPAAQREIHRYIKKYIEQHRAALIIATHQLSQAEELCDEYGLLHRGSMRFNGTMEDVYRRLSLTGRVEIAFAAAVDAKEVSRLISRFDVTAECGRDQRGRTDKLLLSGSALERDVPDIVNALCRKRMRITRVAPLTTSLHQVYEDLIKT